MIYAVEMHNIMKYYPGVVAVDNGTVRIAPGEVHGLIGENGAGKSTMMNILYGMTKPDSGTIKIDGKEVEITSPSKAMDLGISMVHQHFMLVPSMTVLRNIILGNTPVKYGLIDDKKAAIRINEIITNYGLNVDINAKVSQLSVGEKQRVEIIKALYNDSKVLILDEPTAVLTPAETDELIKVLKKLKDAGRSIIFITHKLREVMAVTDSITVMRKGKITGNCNKEETNPKELAQLMVGREVDLAIPRKAFNPSGEVLELRGVSAVNKRGALALKNINFSIRKGEVVGIAGVEGNGQTELISVISGLGNLAAGSIIFMGQDIKRVDVRGRREMGMAHVPEDRLKVGTAKNCSVYENLILNKYYQAPYSKAGILNSRKLSELCDSLKEDYVIKVPDSDYALSTLSGGNMQKVVFAREMDTQPMLLIAAQPTRGVDIGAMEYLHGEIIKARDSERSVLLISAELDEILSLSDRILVMYEGEIVADLNRDETDEQEIGRYMMGGVVV